MPLWAAAAPDTPPTVASAADAPYPQTAKELGIEGRVVLRLSIDEEGRVTDAVVVEEVHPLLDTAALQAARQLRFNPALDQGVPVASVVPWAFVFSLGFAGDDSVDELVTVRGTVEDPGGLPIPLVSVRLTPEQGDAVEVSAGESGRFVARFLDPGRYRVILSKSGFLSAEHSLVLKGGETANVRFVLNPEEVNEYVVIGIRDTWRDVERGAREVEEEPVTSTYELTRRDIESTPGSLEDIARATHALPGVVADGDLLAGFHVRGGEQSDVVYLIDRVPLDNPFHLAGFNSVFNPDMIQSVQFYAGAPPAEVPATTSAVMAVQSWDGAPRAAGRGIDGAVDISASSARLLVLGPIDQAEKLTVALAGRRTYLEGYFEVMKALNVIDTAFAAPEYSELSARVAYRPSDRHRLILTTLRSGDSLALVDSGDDALVSVDGTFELKNTLNLVSLDHTATLGESSEWRSTVAYTSENSFLSRSLAGTVTQDIQVRRVYGRSDLKLALGEHELKVGADGSWQQVGALGTIQDARAVPRWSQAGIADLGLGDIDVDFAAPWPEASAYAQGLIRGPVRVRGGVRATYSGLSDQLLASPRFGISVPLRGGTTVPKLSWGTYHRNPRDPFRLDDAIGNPNLTAERSTQWVFGVDQAFPLPGDEAGGLLRVEAYRFTLSDLVVNPDNEAAVQAGPPYANAGSGVNQGIDVMAVARSPRWGAQLTYGLLSARRTNPLNEVYRTELPPPQDQRHTLGLSGEWQPLPQWRFTTRYTFHSGRPLAAVQVASPTTVRIASLNRGRLGPTHQVDLRAEWRRAYKHYRLTFYAEILNVGNIQSDFLPIHDVQESELSTTMLRHLPMRPFLGLRADF